MALVARATTGLPVLQLRASGSVARPGTKRPPPRSGRRWLGTYVPCHALHGTLNVSSTFTLLQVRRLRPKTPRAQGHPPGAAGAPACTPPGVCQTHVSSRPGMCCLCVFPNLRQERAAGGTRTESLRARDAGPSPADSTMSTFSPNAPQALCLMTTCPLESGDRSGPCLLCCNHPVSFNGA